VKRRFVREVRQFSAAFDNWHASCSVLDEPAQNAPVQRKQEGSPMKTMFAQATTFALSALGALAIFVGVIDQPKLVYDAAAATPAVSHLA